MKKRILRLRKSFGYAGNGILHALVTQPNMWIHAFIGVCTATLAWVLGFGMLEWAILIILISQVFILEMVNTVAELVVDLASPEFSDLARSAKDVGAGAVLIAATSSVIGGAILFLPKLWKAFL